jgi:hypothetical protein
VELSILFATMSERRACKLLQNVLIDLYRARNE